MALSGKALHLPPLSLSYPSLRDLFMKPSINQNTGKPFLSVVIKLRKLPYLRGQSYILTISHNTNGLGFEVFKINKYHSMIKLKNPKKLFQILTHVCLQGFWKYQIFNISCIFHLFFKTSTYSLTFFKKQKVRQFIWYS